MIAKFKNAPDCCAWLQNNGLVQLNGDKVWVVCFREFTFPQYSYNFSCFFRFLILVLHCCHPVIFIYFDIEKVPKVLLYSKHLTNADKNVSIDYCLLH